MLRIAQPGMTGGAEFIFVKDRFVACNAAEKLIQHLRRKSPRPPRLRAKTVLDKLPSNAS
jgi:hypothetical protein